MLEVTPHTVVGIGESEYCLLLLKEKDGPRLLPVWMRAHRAQPIVLCMNKVRLARPQTHDLFINVCEKLGARLVRGTVYDVEEGGLMSRILMEKDGEQITLECSASDGIAMAAKKGIPITVSDEIMPMAGFRPAKRKAGASETRSREEEKLAVWRDFIEGLDLNGLQVRTQQSDCAAVPEVAMRGRGGLVVRNSMLLSVRRGKEIGRG